MPYLRYILTSLDTRVTITKFDTNHRGEYASCLSIFSVSYRLGVNAFGQPCRSRACGTGWEGGYFQLARVALALLIRDVWSEAIGSPSRSISTYFVNSRVYVL